MSQTGQREIERNVQFIQLVGFDASFADNNKLFFMVASLYFLTLQFIFLIGVV